MALINRHMPPSWAMQCVRRGHAWSTIPPISRTRTPLPNGSPMKFEHLIEINDPLNPLIDTLSLE
ncbi:MAG: hypothetical protein RR860_09645, partial [Janthinobacterium sp.]